MLENVTPWLNWFWFGLKVLSKRLILRGKDESNQNVFLLGLVAASLSLSFSYSRYYCTPFCLFLTPVHSTSFHVFPPVNYFLSLFKCALVRCRFSHFMSVFSHLSASFVLALSYPHHPPSWPGYGEFILYPMWFFPFLLRSHSDVSCYSPSLVSRKKQCSLKSQGWFGCNVSNNLGTSS